MTLGRDVFNHPSSVRQRMITAVFLWPNPRIRATLQMTPFPPLSLDFPGLAAMFRATFGKSEPPDA
jgi:hypothetical protein